MDPGKMKVVDLRSELGALGLDTKGNKPALVERLKKALESKTGKLLPDTSILDTSTEEAGDEPQTPAPRTRRRSSTSRAAATPVKIQRMNSEDAIEESPERQPSIEETREIEDSDSQSPERNMEEDVQLVAAREKSPIHLSDEEASIEASAAVPAPAPAPVPAPVPAPNEDQNNSEETNQSQEESMDTAEVKEENKDDKQADIPPRPLTEEEEWEAMNERLRIKEQERLERERLQKEEDERKLEECKDNPVKLQRLKRKQEKKQRWNNYYRNIEITNKVLAPIPDTPIPSRNKKKTEEAAEKIPEPELNDEKMTLSWYDSDLNQHLELPELNSVVPIAEGAFAHSWAGARATHGVEAGRVCFEVKVGATLSTTEENCTSGIRVGWSIEDASLHLGYGEKSWAIESSGRAVHNGEFKEYGKELQEKDVVGAYVDLESSPCKIFYTINGVEQGIAYEFEKSSLEGKALFPHVLTKNVCYKVNFGNDRYNMLTRTVVVRERIEVPVEQVLEAARKREEEARKKKAEIKAAREARQKARKEEREKEKKAREAAKAAQEAKDKAENPEGEKEMETESENKEENDESEKVDEQKETEVMEVDGDKEENGEKQDAEPEPEAEAEKPAEGEIGEPKSEVKEEPVDQPKEVTEEDFLGGLQLDKRIKFVIRYLVTEEIDGEEACLVPGYVLISHGDLTEGPRRPLTIGECEVILMVGLPGCGKTYWANNHIAQNPEKRYNILSTGAMIDRMMIDCKPFKDSHEGKWDAFVTKTAKCVLKLLEMAQGRRRNFILDQTNVYPSAQKRKLKDFEGYKRIAVVIIPSTEDYLKRKAERESTGKEVPDSALFDMKANFTLPEKCPWIEEIMFPELQEEEAKKVLEEFHQEAKAAGAVKEREKRDRSETSRDREYGGKRMRDDRGRRDDRRRDFRDTRPMYDDRWNVWPTPAPRSRWGPSTRDQRPPRNDRWGGGGRNEPPFPRGGNDFRGGRNDRPMGGNRNERPGGGDRFGRDRDRHSQDRRSGPPASLMTANFTNPNNKTNGMGSWQRGNTMSGPQNRNQPPNRPNQPNNSGPVANRNNPPPAKEGGQTGNNQQNQWNQWGWGNWGNWGQQGQQQPGQQGWGNWANWNAAAGAGSGQSGQTGQTGQTGQSNQANAWGGYTPQQWYQWQQWQQQQQGWPGQYGQQGQQGQQAGATPTTQEQQQMWAQYYQNYGGANANAAGGATPQAVDKK